MAGVTNYQPLIELSPFATIGSLFAAPQKGTIHVIVGRLDGPGGSIVQQFAAADGQYVVLPPKILEMLNSNMYVPAAPRVNFNIVLNNALRATQLGMPFVLPDFGQTPKLFGTGCL
ncbi:hypothetical protein BGX26_004659 [Mortierella sp. AD094]|nr:hypothetical protein BGX26_004659 [Mortierella sp. AD094]